MSAPTIDNVVKLLKKFDPNSLEALRLEYPEEADRLRVGIVMGPKASTNLRLAASAKGLNSAVKTCNSVLPQIRKKLKRANSIRLISELMTILAGASVFTVLATSFPNFVRYTIATVALAGSLLALIATYMGGTFHPTGGSLADAFADLVECQVEAKGILQELKVLSSEDSTDSSADETIRAGNDLCGRILRTINFAV